MFRTVIPVLCASWSIVRPALSVTSLTRPFYPLSCYIDLCNGYRRSSWEQPTGRNSAVFSSLITAVSAASEPAGGAALDQVAIATTGAMIATGILLYVVIGHRWGRVGVLKYFSGV